MSERLTVAVAVAVRDYYELQLSSYQATRLHGYTTHCHMVAEMHRTVMRLKNLRQESDDRSAFGRLASWLPGSCSETWTPSPLRSPLSTPPQRPGRSPCGPGWA